MKSSSLTCTTATLIQGKTLVVHVVKKISSKELVCPVSLDGNIMVLFLLYSSQTKGDSLIF